MKVRAGKLAAAVALGGASIAALAVLGRRRGLLRRSGGRLRVERGLAALRLAALPGWARDLYGYPAPPPMTPARRTEIRQTLGVFDAVFMAEPGVLEARQQLALRMRVAAGGTGGHGG